MTSKMDGRRQSRQTTPMSLELIGVLEMRRVEFERKFGRPPRRGEPLFFDPAADVPRRLSQEALAAAMAMVTALSGLGSEAFIPFG
jgi:hypothetical protein